MFIQLEYYEVFGAKMHGIESFENAPVFSLNAANLLPEFKFRATVSGCYCSAALVMCNLFVSFEDMCSVC